MGTRKPQFGGSTKDKFFDDFEVVDKEEVNNSGWGKGSSRLDEICAPSNSNKSAWEQDLNENVAKSALKSTSSWENNFESKQLQCADPGYGRCQGISAAGREQARRSVIRNGQRGDEFNSESETGQLVVRFRTNTDTS